VGEDDGRCSRGPRRPAHGELATMAVLIQEERRRFGPLHRNLATIWSLAAILWWGKGDAREEDAREGELWARERQNRRGKEAIARGRRS
jgi:hypothetical protein